jgi:cytochrome c oxidase subunit 2
LNVAGATLWSQEPDTYSGKHTDVSSEKDQILVGGYAQQFRWYFHYAGADRRHGRTNPGLVDAAEGNPAGLDHSDPAAADDIVSTTLVLPERWDVRLDLHAQDVIHSFFVPALRLKQDVVPGQDVWIHLGPLKEGTYDIACAQLCGMGHYQMNAKLKVVPETEYKAWLAQQSAAKVAGR